MGAIQFQDILQYVTLQFLYTSHFQEWLTNDFFPLFNNYSLTEVKVNSGGYLLSRKAVR